MDLLNGCGWWYRICVIYCFTVTDTVTFSRDFLKLVLLYIKPSSNSTNYSFSGLSFLLLKGIATEVIQKLSIGIK